ncbi:MAG: helix-turn-helix transcriptional regulator [Eubacteriales bacterium]|nr:helix-turn-helix transcriptional regulator [Eubacteriales bacterium]
MTTGEKIAALRRAAGLSQEALADRLDLSRQAVSKWEADQAVPGMDNLLELSRIFGVSVDTLLRPDEELPGKSGEGQEQEMKATVSPKGFYVSYKPVLTRKTKAFIIAVALLFAVSAVGSVVSLVGLTRLQERLALLQSRVDALPAGGDVIYMPSPDSGAAEAADMADARVDYTLDRADPTKLSLQISAMPREIDATESAQFCVKGGGQSVTVPAAYENGSYTGTAQFPLMDTVSVYLLLTKEGATRNLLVRHLEYLEDEYQLYVDASLAEGGLSWSAGRGASLTGRMCVSIESHAAETVLYPVSGRVVVYVNGEEYDSLPIDDITARAEEWRQPDMAGATRFYYIDLPWTQIDAEMDAVTWTVEITDNFGRVQTTE